MYQKISVSFRLIPMLALIGAACGWACCVPRFVHAQSTSGVAPCSYGSYDADTEGCREQNKRGGREVLYIIGGMGLIVWIGWLVTTNTQRTSRDRRRREDSRVHRNEQAEDLARAAAAVAQLNQGSANATNMSVSVSGRVGGVDVRIHANRSAREEAEAKALGSYAQPMSNHKEL